MKDREKLDILWRVHEEHENRRSILKALKIVWRSFPQSVQEWAPFIVFILLVIAIIEHFMEMSPTSLSKYFLKLFGL
jgi:hypothetical protein